MKEDTEPAGIWTQKEQVYVLTIFAIKCHMLNLSYKTQTFKLVANQELKAALTLLNFSCTDDDKTTHQGTINGPC